MVASNFSTTDDLFFSEAEADDMDYGLDSNAVTTASILNATTLNPADLEDLVCPEYSKETEKILEVFAFWLEGVVLCIIAVPGIFGNALSSYILARKSMRNSFNLLLIALAIIDNTYLFGAILESCRKRFRLHTDIHILLFPYFLYPVHMMAMTGSIFMTVAIALERYVAVHYPINYSQTMNDSRALKRRVMQYLGPVTIVSILFNVTKFFEISVYWRPIMATPTPRSIGISNATNGTNPMMEDNGNGVSVDYNMTTWRAALNVTEFRTNPIYSIGFNWFRFISIGIIPFVLLVYFNAQIYLDIRKQRRKRDLRSRRQTHSYAVTEVTEVNASGGNGNHLNARDKRLRTTIRRLLKKSQMKAEAAAAANSGRDSRDHIKLEDHHHNGNGNSSGLRESDTEVGEASALIHQSENSKNKAMVRPAVLPVSSSSTISRDKDDKVRETIEASPEQEDEMEDDDEVARGQAEGRPLSAEENSSKNGPPTPCSSCDSCKCADCHECCSCEAEHEHDHDKISLNPKEAKEAGVSPKNGVAPPKKVSSTASMREVAAASTQVTVKRVSIGAQTQTVTTTTMSLAPASNNTNSHAMVKKNNKDNNSNERGRTGENSLAAIMMGYVLVFLICHSPRLLLNLHELTTIRNAMACGKAGKHTFAVWSLIVMHISHLLLVINSSINILIYVCMSQKFREEGKVVLYKLVSTLTCGRFYANSSGNNGNFLNSRYADRQSTILVRNNQVRV